MFPLMFLDQNVMEKSDIIFKKFYSSVGEKK